MRTNALPPRVKRAVAWLRKSYPTAHSVIVRMGPDEMETRGLCIYDEKRALIRLKPGEGESTLDTLLEEWAHVLRAECPLPQDDDHDAVFWAIYQLMSRKWRGE